MLAHNPTSIADIWAQFQPRILPALGAEDDANLWAAAIGQIIADAEYLCAHAETSSAVLAEIGRCSHWLRPHQSRWTAAGGFAWPSGYGGSGFSRNGLPEFDWSLLWRWETNSRKWELNISSKSKRPLKLRIAIPSRTSEHEQAAVHTIWSPGSPTTPKQKLRQFYGFRKQGGAWNTAAYQATNEAAYDGI